MAFAQRGSIGRGADGRHACDTLDNSKRRRPSDEVRPFTESTSLYGALGRDSQYHPDDQRPLAPRRHIAGGIERDQGTIMAIGTVKFLNTSKGFGFISPEGGDKDVFVHATAVEAAGMRSLAEGHRVSFDVQPDARGSKAVNLKAG